MSRFLVLCCLALWPWGAGAVTDRIIVELNPMAAKAGQVVSLDPGSGWPRLSKVRGSGGRWVLRSEQLLRDTEAEALAARLAEDPRVRRAEPDRILYPARIPDDSYWPDQWYLGEPSTAPAALGLPTAWSYATGDPSVVVAVVDTGVLSHADLAARLLPGYDFVSDPVMARDGDGRDGDASDPGDDCGVGSSWHGTAVAGVLGAVTDNGLGISGVDWAARILPVRVLGACGGYTSDIADGILWAAGLPVPGAPDNPHPARVINLSMGGWGSCGFTLQGVIDAVRAAGVTVVAAAGNDGGDAALSSPGNCAGVITVAAARRDGGATAYTNTGSVVDLAAPGGDGQGEILSLANDGVFSPGNDGYAFFQGTSMAAPLVSGVAALVRSLVPDLSPDALRELMMSHSRPFPSGTGHDCTGCGAGLLDAAAVLAAVTPNAAPELITERDLRVRAGAPVVLSAMAEDPDGDPVTIRWRQLEGDEVGLDLSKPDSVSFIAPPPPARLLFEVVAEDGRGGRDTARVAVTVNEPPWVEAGDDQVQTPGGRVVLTGQAEDDTGIVSWSWVQVSGNEVVLEGGQAAQAAFTAPLQPGVLRFRLTVEDQDGEQAEDIVSVRINAPPEVSASGPERVNPGARVSLQGQAEDAQDDALAYQWTQIDGVAVALDEADSSTVVFVAPETSGPLRFRLRVEDRWGGVGEGEVVVSVNAAPVIRLAPVDPPGVAGVFLLDASASTDPDGDALGFFWQTMDGDTLGEGAVLRVTGAAESQRVRLVVRDVLGLESRQDIVLPPWSPPGEENGEEGGAPAVPSPRVSLSIDQTSVAVEENGSALRLQVERRGDGRGEVRARWVVVAGDAEAGVDFLAPDAEMVWGDGETGVREQHFIPLDDNLDEGPETVTLALRQGKTEWGRLEVTLRDDERPPGGWVRFVESAVAVSEGAGQRVLVVERVNGEGAITVAYDSEGVEADASDYQPLSGVLNWADGEKGSREIVLEIHDDPTGEPDERLRLHLIPLAGGAAVAGANPLTITLMDDDPRCFIATAAHGSGMAREVRWLRAFRDQYLLPHPAGRALVAFYYRHSPPLAEWIAGHDTARVMVRALLRPWVWLSEQLVDPAVFQAQSDERP